MNLMVTLIIILGVLAVVHFAYEAILVPSFRQAQRFRLFALRDQLRTLKSENPGMDNSAFHALDDSLSWQLDNQHRLTPYMMAIVDHQYTSDKDFRDNIEKRMRILEKCQIDDFIRIRRAASRQFLGSVIINSGVWLICLVPLVMGVVWINSLRKRASRMIALPKRELEHYASPAC
jgi:hypothetical protein